MRVAEAGAGAGEVRELGGGGAGPAAGEAGAHVTSEHRSVVGSWAELCTRRMSAQLRNVSWGPQPRP